MKVTWTRTQGRGQLNFIRIHGEGSKVQILVLTHIWGQLLSNVIRIRVVIFESSHIYGHGTYPHEPIVQDRVNCSKVPKQEIMHTSWWQFCQNHQVPVGVSPLLLTCCYNKIHKCQICKIINNVRSLPRCKMEVKNWHWLCGCRTWELLIFTWWALGVVYLLSFMICCFHL